MKSNKVTRGIPALFVMMLLCFAFTGVASASQGYDGVATTMGHANETIRVVMINSSSQTVNLLNPYNNKSTAHISRTTLGFSEKGPNPGSINLPPLNARSFELAFNGYDGGFDMLIGFNGSGYQNVKLSIKPTHIVNTGAIAEFAVHLIHAALDVAEFALEPGDPLAIFGLVKNVLEMTKEATDFGDSATFSMIMANDGSILKNKTGFPADGHEQPGWSGTGVYWVYGNISQNHRIAVAPTHDLNGGYGFPMVGANGNQGMIFDVTGGTSQKNDPTGKSYATLIITIHDDNSFNKAMKKYNQDNNANLGFTWDRRNCHPKTDFTCNLHSGNGAANGPFLYGDQDFPTTVTVNVGAKMSVLPNANGMLNSGTVIFRNFTPFGIQADSQIMPMTAGPAAYGNIWVNNGVGGLAANGGQAAYPFGFSKNDPNYFWIVNFGIQDSAGTKFKFDLRPTLSGGDNSDLQNAWTKLSRQIATMNALTNAPPAQEDKKGKKNKKKKSAPEPAPAISPNDAYGQLNMATVIPGSISRQNPFLSNTNAVSGMIYSPNDFFAIGSHIYHLKTTASRDHVAVTDGKYIFQIMTINHAAQPTMLVNVYTVQQWAAIDNPSPHPQQPLTPPQLPAENNSNMEGNMR